MIPNLQLWDFFQGTQEQVRNSRGKRAISVRAIEVLLYYVLQTLVKKRKGGFCPYLKVVWFSKDDSRSKRKRESRDEKTLCMYVEN